MPLLIQFSATLGVVCLLVGAATAAEPERTGQPPSSQAGTLKFELDIQPILTARGCNSGPCHGKARGQNGFALSLLAFDPDFDYQSIVSDARGRRMFPASPDKSLFLQKAVGAMPHGGGVRIELGDRYDGAAPDARSMQLWTVRTGSDLLDAFGRPDPNQDPPCERMPDATMVQALHLMNANTIQNKLTSESGRVQRLATSDGTLEKVIEELYLACYSRRPTPAETQALLESTPQPNPARRQWIEDLLWSLVNSPEFLYID